MSRRRLDWLRRARDRELAPQPGDTPADTARRHAALDARRTALPTATDLARDLHAIVRELDTLTAESRDVAEARVQAERAMISVNALELGVGSVTDAMLAIERARELLVYARGPVFQQTASGGVERLGVRRAG